MANEDPWPFGFTLTAPRAPSPLPACGERSAPKAPGEGGFPQAEPLESPPHLLAALATSSRKRGEVTEFAALSL